MDVEENKSRSAEEDSVDSDSDQEVFGMTLILKGLNSASFFIMRTPALSKVYLCRHFLFTS